MKPLFAAVALMFAQQCGVFEPAVHSASSGIGDGGAEDGGLVPPYLSRHDPTCDPILVEADAGWSRLPWDGGQLPLLDSGLPQVDYVFPACDMELLRERIIEPPGVGLGIDAPSEELRASASLMVGEWTGTRTTPWDGAHPVTFVFFESGHYSVATGDCSSPTYYGERCSAHQLSWRLDTGNAVQAEGELGFSHAQSTSQGVFWMKQVRANANTLSFNLWYRDYGPIQYALTRNGAETCAGKNLASCP